MVTWQEGADTRKKVVHANTPLVGALSSLLERHEPICLNKYPHSFPKHTSHVLYMQLVVLQREEAACHKWLIKRPFSRIAWQEFPKGDPLANLALIGCEINWPLCDLRWSFNKQ